MRKFSKIMCYAAVPALCLGLWGGANAAPEQGYVFDNTGVVVRDTPNDCVRSTYLDGPVPTECGGMAEATTPPPVEPMRAMPPQHMMTKTTLEGKALFDTNKSVLKPAGRSSLDRLAREIRSTPDVQEVRVVGYTDSRGTRAHNQILSEHRAQTVKNYLKQKGVRNVTAEGRGEADPVGDNRTASGRAMNRRVEIEVR